ncbi:MAG: PAS domain S-box protein [Cyclobacteriaceae bacterium]
MKKDKRVRQILQQIARFSKGDHGPYMNVTENVDEIDAISAGLNALGEALTSRDSAIKEKEERINALLEILLRYTTMDFSVKAPLCSSGDEIDALGAGLNALGEELVYHTSRLKDSEEQIKTIFNNAPDAVIVIDSKGIIVRWNPAAERILGWTEEEVKGRFLHEILIPDRYREKHIAGMKHFLKTGEGPVLNKTIELPALCKDQSELEIELTISPARLKDEYIFISFLRDITDRKKAEGEIRHLNATLEQRVLERTKELHQSENKYRNLFENNPMPLWIVELPSLRFFDVNDSALRQYGYSRQEFLSMTTFDIRPEDEKIRLLQLNHSPPLTTNIPTLNSGIWKHLKKDGTIIHAEVYVHEITVDGKPARLVLSNDVTERKKIEMEIINLNKDLEQRVAKRTEELQIANKELESFSYSVSHDLRVPLRAIHGYSQMLIEDYEVKLDGEGKRLINNVQTNAKKMGQLVDDLLEFSRLGKRELNTLNVDLTSIAEAVINELTHAGNVRAKIKVHSLGKAKADPALLKHVFQNLIANAIKYSSKKEDPEVEIGLTEVKSGKTYFVKDNGTGFDMAYYNKLFGVFQRLHGQEEFEGTGVGLAIVHRIITRHHGKIWADGKVDEGATFYFTLDSSTLNENI